MDQDRDRAQLNTITDVETLHRLLAEQWCKLDERAQIIAEREYVICDRKQVISQHEALIARHEQTITHKRASPR